MSLPKEGSIERVVLDALYHSKTGMSYLDFPPELGMTDELLAEVVERLRHGIYEAEDDSVLKFDA